MPLCDARTASFAVDCFPTGSPKPIQRPAAPADAGTLTIQTAANWPPNRTAGDRGITMGFFRRQQRSRAAWAVCNTADQRCT